MKKIKNNISNIYPLSPMQEGMLFHFLEDGGASAYVQQIAWQIEGHLDFKCFEAAWNELIRRHDILRTLFVYLNVDTPLQVVLEERRLAVDIVDIDQSVNDQRQAFRQHFKQQQRAKPFALDTDILLRLQILVLGDDSCEVVLTHHHIIMDGWSLGNLVKESLDIYQRLIRAEQPRPATARPYRQYIKWLQDRDDQASLEFWNDYIADYEVQATPVQIAHPGAQKDDPARAAQQGIDLEMGKPLVDKLALLAQSHGVTLNTLFQALWGFLLCRYNNASDVVFGAVVSGRPHDLPGVESMAGIFINTIAVRTRLEVGMTLGELLQRMQEDALRCERHHSFSLARVQAQSPLRNRLLGSLFVMENYPLDDIFEEGAEIPGTEFRVSRMETYEDTHFDFGIRFLPDDGMKIKIGYNTALYAPIQMQRLAEHLQSAATAFAELGGVIPLDRIDILGASERRQIVTTFNDTAMAFRRHKTIAEIFHEQVERDPNAPAVVFNENTLSYGELNRRAETVARRLREDFNIQPDERVGLLLERSHWTAVGIIAVLKAGGAYVPMEASYPEERKRYILSDSGCRALLVDDTTQADAASLDFVPCLNIEVVSRQQPGGEALAPIRVTPDNLAYVIYTSGSTGQPKGVMIEQRSVVNLVDAMIPVLYVNDGSRMNLSLVTTYVFDGSVHQIFSALLSGHCLHIMDDEIKRDTRRFAEFSHAHSLDVTGCIPNFLALLHEAGEFPVLKAALPHMIFGGEPLPGYLLAELVNPADKMIVSNLYGPTECCVNATTYSTSRAPSNPSSVVPIGKPLGNVEIYILDQWGGIAPIGVAGELCIAGEGVGRGYLNNEALTREKFVPHVLDPSRRMFRTGDMTRWREDGNIEYLGRNDDQIKIMGYRIEPGEIEEKLEGHPQVREVAVVPVQDKAGRYYLRACVSVYQDNDAAELRRYLGASLPQHMIPSSFMFFDGLPTLMSDKIDRKALAGLEEPSRENAAASPCVAPRTQTEEILLHVWRAVFGRNDIGIEDDYFSLGGDSIRAIQILSRLYREDLKINIKDMFNHPTVAELAPFVMQAEQREREEVTGKVPLTPVQRRFFKEFRLAPQWFNHAITLSSENDMDEVAAEQALRGLCEHHDAFRMRFYRNGEEGWVQEATEEGMVMSFAFLDIRGRGDEGAVIAQRADEIHRSFDLKSGPLAKAALFRGEDGDRLLIVVHHLLIDGISWRILIENFQIAYEDILAGRPIALPATGDSLKRWGLALEQYAASATLLKEKDYWRQMQTADVTPVPLEVTSPLNRHCDLQTQTRKLSEAETSLLLGGVNHAYGTSSEEILLVSLARALRSWKGIDTCAVILEGHGREDVLGGLAVERTIGWFTSMYPVILDLPAGFDTGLQVKTIKEILRRVPVKGFGYGVLKYMTPDALKDDMDFCDNANVRFNYLGQFGTGAQTSFFQISTDDTGEAVNPEAERLVDIDVSAMVLEDELEVSIACSRHRFRENSLREFLDIFYRELLAICNHCATQQTVELTPADLTSSDISLDELEDMFS